MIKLKVFRKRMKYICPGVNIVDEILKIYGKLIRNNDFIVISEKAFLCSTFNIFDESLFKCDLFSKFITYLIERVLWCLLLSRICLSKSFKDVVCSVDLCDLTKHKKYTISICKIMMLDLLKPFSECGIDVTNLPYTYATKPIKDIDKYVQFIRFEVFKKLKKIVNVMIIDSDVSYKPKIFKNVVFSSRFSKVKGILNFGVLTYFICRCLGFRCYPTIVAYSGLQYPLPLLLKIAKLSMKYMKSDQEGSIFDLAKKFQVDYKRITWSMLSEISHYPVVIVRIFR